MFLKGFIESLGLKTKGNMTITAVISCTGDVCNGVTINAELSSDENELVYKTFATTDGIVDSAKGMARMGGFPTNAEEFVGAMGGSNDNLQAR